MRTDLEVLDETELAVVVSGVDSHRLIRETTGMCGCGLCSLSV